MAEARRKSKRRQGFKGGDNSKSFKCFECGEIGHYKINCPNKRAKKDDDTVRYTMTTPSYKNDSCFRCGERGHYKINCPLLVKRVKEVEDNDSARHESILKSEIKSSSEKGHHQTLPPAELQKPDLSVLPANVKTLEKQEQNEELKLDELESCDDMTPNNVEQNQSHDDLRKEPVMEEKQPLSSNDDLEENDIDDNPLPLFDDDIFVTEEEEKNEKAVTQVREKQVFQKNRTKHKDLLLYQRVAKFPQYLDTHCHIEYLLERHRLSSYSDMSLKFCYPPNFEGCITSFCDPAAFSSFGCYEELLEEKNVWASFGMHPHHARSFSPLLEERLLKCLAHPKCVALGEIGLDFSRHSLKQSSETEQRKLLSHLLQYSQAFSKPVILHCRDAEEDLYEILCTDLPSDSFIHLHCYTGSIEMAKRFTATFPNLYIGLTGHVTDYKFEDSRYIAREFPLKHLLIETDAPYMMPFSMRPKGHARGLRWTHPPMAVCVAEEIARLRDCLVEEVLTATRENARTLYGI